MDHKSWTPFRRLMVEGRFFLSRDINARKRAEEY
jgi:hypothetical protein